ncbi:thiamine-binding protein, partial [Staphylococcus aureus]
MLLSFLLLQKIKEFLKMKDTLM